MAYRNVTRWSASNTVPVVFVLGIIAITWLTYVRLHLMRLLQPYKVPEEVEKTLGFEGYVQQTIWQILLVPAAYFRAPKEVDETLRFEGYVQLTISQILLALMMICFVRAVCTDPGSVPETNDWLRLPVTGPGEGRRPSTTFEVKQSGKRRFCQKCNKYKPDRCHHCRVCNSCILRMDHHCPWIANCVGWGNHKYFFLLVLYSGANCVYIIATMSSTLAEVIAHMETETPDRFNLVFGMTVSWIMAILLLGFFAFHSWLMTGALTTIEFCEKRTTGRGFGTLSFSHGLYENMRAVLGPNPLLWLLPLAPPTGDGLCFPIRPRMSVTKEPSDGKAAASSSQPVVRSSEPEVTGESPQD